MQFKGWAQTSVQLSFDQSKQTVYGQLNESVNLDGVAPMANNFVTVFVQNAINQQVNPLELLRARIAPVIPVKASGGVVKAQVKDVRAEVLDGSLKRTSLTNSAALGTNVMKGANPVSRRSLQQTIDNQKIESVVTPKALAIQPRVATTLGSSGTALIREL